MSLTVLILCLLASLAISFLMSGMEAGVFAMSRLRIRQQVRAGNPRAAALLRYLEHPEHFLWTILVGNTLANFTLVSLTTFALRTTAPLARHDVVFWVVLLLCVLVFYAVGDLLPKMLFRTYPNRLCMRMAIPFRTIDWLMRPLVWCVEVSANLLLRWTGGGRFTGHLFGSRDELRLLMQETGQNLSSEEHTMINRVLDLQNRLVGEIAIPLDKVAMLSVDASVEELFKLRRESGFTRYPVWRLEARRRRIVGFINSQKLLYEEGLDTGLKLGVFLKPA
ncbi:MAG: DUF21 domain-containing protein, partial [Verrucomicrobia bacterium]|nr:DUF21 domain-containing protein [Verrucomicrobiota bacterium]